MAPDLPVWLVVAGGREHDTDELVAQGHRLLGDRLRTLVGFPRERMPDLYRSADVFALTSLMEMMPIALIEATASGLPCLVNKHPVLEWISGPGGERDRHVPARCAARSLHSWLVDTPRRREARRTCKATLPSRTFRGTRSSTRSSSTIALSSPMIERIR